MERRCIRWRADSEKFVVAANCERRGWVRWDPADGDDWNFYWCVVGAHRDSLVWGSCVQGLGGGGGGYSADTPSTASGVDGRTGTPRKGTTGISTCAHVI